VGEARRVVVGSETQYLESLTFVAGIQRVMRETHAALTDLLAPHGVDVVPLHTRDRPRRMEFRAVDRWHAPDPVLDRRPARIGDVDVAVLLDLHTEADYAALFRERRLRRLPVVSLVHDLLPITHPGMFHDGARAAFRVYLQQVLAVSDHLVVSTHKVADDLRGLGWRIGGDLHVIAMGTTFRPRPATPPPDDRISLLYVSTVEPRKGHDVLLDAYALLRSAGHDVDLTLVGREGWQVAGLARRLRTHPDAGGRLRWLESADDLTVATIARSCTIGLFPAIDEGFGLFVEEGLAYGLAMVVSDIPVFRERARPNLFFADRTPAAFAEAILRAHRAPWHPIGPGEVRTMRDFGRDVAELVRSVLP